MKDDHKRYRRFVFAMLLILFFRFEIAMADTVWLVGSERPIYGIVDSQTDDSIVFLRTNDGKEFEKILIEREQIETVVVNRDNRRLESLQPAKVENYFDYAEELVAQKRDPVARNLAMRLLVIVVSKSQESSLRQNALKHLIDLARTPEERKSFESLVFFETGLRQQIEKQTVADSAPSTESRIAAANFVRTIRQRKTAAEQLKDEKIKATIEYYKAVCSWEEVVQIAKVNRIDNRQLKKLVALERRLRCDWDETVAFHKRRVSWSDLSRRVPTKTVAIPQIETATEFDPTFSLYTKGRWISEESGAPERTSRN